MIMQSLMPNLIKGSNLTAGYDGERGLLVYAL